MPASCARPLRFARELRSPAAFWLNRASRARLAALLRGDEQGTAGLSAKERAPLLRLLQNLEAAGEA